MAGRDAAAAAPVRPRLVAPLRAYFRQVAGLLVIGSLAGIVMNTAVVLPSVLLGHAIDVVSAYSAGHADSGTVTLAVLTLVAGSLATEIPRIGKRYWLGAARSRIRANLRADALRGVLSWPAERLHTTAVGEVIARIIGDTEVVGTGVGEVIVETWDTLLFSLSLIVAMLWFDPVLALLAIAPVPVALILAKAAGAAVARRTITARTANAALTSFVQEGLSGLRVLQVTGRAGAWAERMRGRADSQCEAELAVTRLGSVLAPVYTTVTSAGVIAVLWYGGVQVAHGRLSVGALVALLSLFARFTARAFRIPQMANRVQAGASALTRLRPLLAEPPQRDGGPRWAAWRTGLVDGLGSVPAGGPASVQERDWTLEFHEVRFSYSGTDAAALTDVGFTVRPGSLVAVTGAVGSGKTALARLAAGVYPPDSGRVTVGGADAYRMSQAARAGLGYVPQGHPVFSGTVAENIDLADPGSGRLSRRGEQAVRLAALAPDLAAMPEGTATPIGELGVRISGGQRQRLALARALAAPPRPPRLLVLDDPFSALDLETENRIIDALRLAVGPTAPPEHRAGILLCSTRLAAFGHADQVIVLDQGRIAETGSHTALLAQNGHYARIHRALARAADTGAVP